MSSRNKPPARRIAKVFAWQRWIDPNSAEQWLALLPADRTSITQRPERRQALLAVYWERQSEATALAARFGGKVKRIPVEAWNKPSRIPDLKISDRLQISHNPSARQAPTALCIPHGLAFGSGKHGTTYLLLRELARRISLSRERVLDLGTGSGVLALAARRLGANRIVATDYDAEAVRTARANERLNFRSPLIIWQRADVMKLRARPRYQLILANLFSGILIEAAPAIVAAMAPGGELWLSGILRKQSDEVARAYRRSGVRLIGSVSRGKWMLLRFDLPPAQETGAGELKKTVQTK